MYSILINFTFIMYLYRINILATALIKNGLWPKYPNLLKYFNVNKNC